ncbi:MAG: amidase [Clostridia bacterium]|nr:amidase [Clostridia bacterium]
MGRYTIQELSALFREKKISPLEHTKEAFRRIEAENSRLHAFIYLNEESAIEQARQAEKNFMEGIVKSPLQGITVGIKDLIWTKDAPVTMECEYYYEHPLCPQCDSTVAGLLKEQGAVILGKTNTHALGMGSTGDVSWSGCARNPHDISKVTGGSSSGSAAAVAAGLCDLAFGHDSGGSVRIPSAHCGLTGIKPTFGRVSKFGLSGLGLSCDCIGPLAGSVEDCAVALSGINGYDPKDEYSLKLQKEDYTAYLDEGISGMTVAVPMAWIMEEPLQEEVRTAVLRVIEVLKSLGVKIVDVSANGLMPTREGLAVYRAAHQTILSSDGFFLHQEALKQPEKLPKQALDRLLAGNISALERNQAYSLRNHLRQIFNGVFEIADVFLTPTLTGTACGIGDQEIAADGKMISVYAAYSEFTWQASFAGLPAMSLPCGKDSQGLPIGVMFTADSLEEKEIFRIGYALEKALPIHM